MTRTIQTAINLFPWILGSAPFNVDVQIWPDLREAHDAICNQGISQAEMARKFPAFNLTECSEEWDYPPYTIEDATARAESVRHRLKEASKRYRNILIITHRGFLVFLVQGDRYEVCETRSYRFCEATETEIESKRMGFHIETNDPQDFGPTVLLPYQAHSEPDETLEISVE
ncbi:hypothetical protein N7462_003892 [Penicillium macrosclerotiorum]|uniref:uncharacterized protein n=1 Tax=Penicillium macrosclerotiorum TaxID=303699 RepID=UPI00254878B7|nr:uncharacterized protein N7462_003892 [Penicillium macrosclerotiorum]KAJ5689500.1 hypothetical protein N7462_003892 [Penicillium macrosclerotiorum]